ncbi:MAG: extracellular solute-binding protein [Spirochaetales bacterium]|nr:extracellular solute-binding protein [Spirochaetales bacterium]
MKSAALKLIFFTTCLISLTAFGHDDSGETAVEQRKPVIRMAYSWGHGFKNTVAAYKERMKDDFILETEESIGLNHKQKILIDLSSGTLPDVFLFWSYETNLKYLAEKGYLLDIQEYFDASETVERDDFFEESLKATEVNGINYAVPHEVFFGFMAANKSLFDQYGLDLPETWDDLRAITPVFREHGIVPFYLGSFRGDPGHLFFSALTYQHPDGYRDTLDLRSSLKFITPATEMAADGVIDLIDMKAIPENTIYAGSFEQQIDEYNERRTALSYSFTWSLALFSEDIAKDTVIIPVPRMNSRSLDTENFTIGGMAQSVCINRKSWNDPEKRESIIKVVDWLLSDEIYETRMLQSGNIPAKKMAYPELKNSMYRKVFDYREGVEVLGIQEFYFNSLTAFETYKEAVDLLWSGVLGKEEFLEMVQNAVVESHE